MTMHTRFALAMIPIALLAGCEPAKPTVAAKPKIKLTEIKGKTTQVVLKLDQALADGGVLAATSVTSTDYLGAVSDSYKTSVAKIAADAVKHTIDLRNASNIQEPKPLTYDELMAEIIKKDQPDGLQLPKLPYYQEYAWDEANQKLVVVEFPKKKADFKDQQDKELGRK